MIAVAVVILIILFFVLKSMHRQGTSYPVKSGYNPPDMIEKAYPVAERSMKHLYRNADFINKGCTRLEKFVINDDLNNFDLMKLADMNGIQLQIAPGWYPLLIELIKELDQQGWDRQVSCIKEKYASLRFYTDHKYYDTTEKYERRSKYICETCGDKGKIHTSGGWDYTACRKHYRERANKVIVDPTGFALNGKAYLWEDMLDVSLNESNYFKQYSYLRAEPKDKNKYPELIGSGVFVQKSSLGFGNLLGNIPRGFRSMDYDYAGRYRNVAYCAICGYLAVYCGECECCENYTFMAWVEKGNADESEERKQVHIRWNQMEWKMSGAEAYEAEHPFYPKNPDHLILYTQEDLDEYYEDCEDDDF